MRRGVTPQGIGFRYAKMPLPSAFPGRPEVERLSGANPISDALATDRMSVPACDLTAVLVSHGRDQLNQFDPHPFPDVGSELSSCPP